MDRLTLTVAETAEALGVHSLTVRAAIKRGQLPAVSVGRRVLVPVKALESVLAGEDVGPIANGRVEKRRAPRQGAEE